MTEQDELNAWRVVRDAYREAMPPNLLPEHLSQLGVFGTQWLKTKDPSVMDGAISYCHQHKLPILPELLEYVHAAMQKRIADGTAGTKAFRQSAKQRVLEEMAKLTYHGASLRRAAELGAYIAHFKIGYPMKASSLEKEFSKDRKRLENFAMSVFEEAGLSEDEKMQTAALFKGAIEASLDIPDEIIGDRR